MDNLEYDEAGLVMSWGANYKCRFQEEIQSAYFDQNQVNVHILMWYYKNIMKDVKHIIIGRANNSKKNANGVNIFEATAIWQLRLCRKEI